MSSKWLKVTGKGCLSYNKIVCFREHSPVKTAVPILLLVYCMKLIKTPVFFKVMLGTGDAPNAKDKIIIYLKLNTATL